MTDPRIPPDLRGYEGTSTGRTDTDGSVVPSRSVDPLGWCVIATTALLTWLLGPAVLAVLSAVGIVKYWRAWRSGRTDSNCILGDVRLVIAYLVILFAVGAVATALSLT
ncbi:MAG: hypothetical protein AAGA65_16035 [Actinomycetota bacterium]